MITVAKDKNFYNGVRYLEPAINRANYWIWRSGGIPDGPGAYAVNKPVPDISVVKQHGVFCAGVGNLVLRRAGKNVPYRPGQKNSSWDGSVSAYWRSPWGPGYYTGYDEPFRLDKALRWARETRSGVLIGREYKGPGINDQGHVAIVLPSGYVLQSNYGDGLNWKYTLRQSHSGWYYTRMVHPRNWIEYKGDSWR